MLKTTAFKFNAVIEYLLPHYCILCCGSNVNTIYGSICENCLSNLPLIGDEFCQQCAYPLSSTLSLRCGDCLATKHHFDSTIVAFQYKSPVDRLILDFKHYGNFSNCICLVNQLSRTIKQSSIFAVDPPEMLIPVPLHWQRRFQRGFNQAQLIAQQLSRDLQIPIAKDIIRRTHSSSMQQGKSRRQRLAILSKNFEVTADVKAKNIAIVDDVVTTTATIEAIAKQLKTRGAKTIAVYALARTVKHL